MHAPALIAAYMRASSHGAIGYDEDLEGGL
jgi:hypothetical protein